MDIAIGSQPGMWQRTSSDAHCSDVIAPGIALLAVADGFGIVRGTGIGSVALQLLRESLKRRVRGSDPASLRAALSAAFSAASRLFDLNNETKIARTKRSSPIMPPAYAIPSLHQCG